MCVVKSIRLWPVDLHGGPFFSSKSLLASPLCVPLPACPLAVDGPQDSIFVYHFEEPYLHLWV